MTLTNYWWLLIWLVLVGGLLVVVVPKKPVQVLDKTEYRWSWGASLLLACPYVIWAATRVNFGDTEVYRKMFRDMPTLGKALAEYLAEHGKDQGFTVLAATLKTFIGNNDKLFFFLIAVFQMFCIVYFFRRYSTNFFLSMFMFVVSTDYLSWMFNGMRQFIAVCIILLSFELILRKKVLWAIAVILLAATFHASALMMIPLIFVIQGRAWNRKMLLFLACVGVAILLIDPFILLLDSVLAETQYLEKRQRCESSSCTVLLDPGDLIFNWKEMYRSREFGSCEFVCKLLCLHRNPLSGECLFIRNLYRSFTCLYDSSRLCCNALVDKPYVY